MSFKARLKYEAITISVSVISALCYMATVFCVVMVFGAAATNTLWMAPVALALAVVCARIGVVTHGYAKPRWKR